MSKEYENVRQQYEEVKHSRDQAKEVVKNLKEMQSPVKKNIQESEESSKSLDMKIRDKVGISSSPLMYVIFQVVCIEFCKV